MAKTLHIPYFSIDHVASVIPPYVSPDRQDESFPLRALRRKVNNDGDRFFETYSSEEIVRVYQRQAATVWPGVRSFIDYAVEDEHSLILEGWQLLPHFLAEIPAAERGGKMRIQYLYKTNCEDILSGLKANDPVNDWVLRHTKEDASFVRIAQMISYFGEIIERETTALRFAAVNVECDFAKKISELSHGMTV